MTDSKAYGHPIATEVMPLEKFTPAEDFHRNYYNSNKDADYCQIVIAPKLDKLKKRFQNLLRETE